MFAGECYGSGMETKKNRYNIRVIDRALRLLKLLSDGRPRTLTDISRELSVNTSSVFRVLATLTDHNFIEKDSSSGEYWLGLSCLELAGAFLNEVDVRKQALPAMERLRDHTSETVHLGILDQMQVVYLEKFHGLHAIGLMSSRIGGRSPSYCTGLGKVILAYKDRTAIKTYFASHPFKRFTENTITDVDDLLLHLDRIKEQGYAVDDQEHEDGVSCFSAPIFDLAGSVVAAISISGPSERLEHDDKGSELIAHVQQAAAEISRKMGFSE